MSVKNLTSIRTVLDKILRDHIFDGLTLDLAVDWCIEFFEIVGVPNTFIEKKKLLYVGKCPKGKTDPATFYKAKLPEDFFSVITVLIDGHPARYATDTIHNFYDQERLGNPWYGSSTDPRKLKPTVDWTYSIDNGVLRVSEKICRVELFYNAIAIVEEGEDKGLPLIPDNQVFITALKSYIEYQFLRILWRNQKVTDKVYQEAKDDYEWSVGRWSTEAVKLTPDQAESFYNMFSTLIPRMSEFKERWRNTGSQEIMKYK